MRTRMNHFRAWSDAVSYYWQYDPDATFGSICIWVKNKISAQEIVIGPPTLKPGETMYVNDEGRYVIETEEK